MALHNKHYTDGELISDRDSQIHYWRHTKIMVNVFIMAVNAGLPMLTSDAWCCELWRILNPDRLLRGMALKDRKKEEV